MRVLLWFSGAFAAAAALVLCLLPGKTALALGTAALIAAAILLWRHNRFGAVLLGVSLGMLWTTCYGYAVERPALSLAGRTAEISAVASDYSTKSTYGIRVSAKIQLDNVETKAVVWLDSDEDLQPGDTFTVTARIESSSGSGSNYRSEGVYLLAYGSGPPEIFHASSVPLRYFTKRIAHALEDSLSASVPADAVGYAVALTTGNRDNLTSFETETLRDAGISHLLALSGMHLTVLLGTISPIFRRRRTRALVGIPICIIFAVITGAGPSIVRAAVMQCIALAAPLFHRESDAPTSLGAALLLLTIQNPYCLLSWGMQLSFASMAGILLCSDRLYNTLNRALGRGRLLCRFRRALFLSLSSSLSAMVCTVPLMMAYYGTVSLVAPLTNLLTSWAVAWCFRGSLLTAMISLICLPAGKALGWCLAFLIRYIKWVAALLSGLPFASLHTDSLYAYGWILLTYTLTAVILFSRKPRHWKIPSCCIAVGLVVTLLLTVMEGNILTFTALDVGQGQCLILSDGGYTAVIDCGGSQGDSVGDLVAGTALSSGENRIDLLILTHYDLDHASGAAELLRRMDVSMLLLPDMEPENETRQSIEAAAFESGTEIIYVTEVLPISFGSGIIYVYPPVLPIGDNAGLSVLTDANGIRILVTGDMDMEMEEIFLHTNQISQVDILVAGHHGSSYSTSEALLTAVQPKIVLISVGTNNYGHPAQETLDRIAASGAEIYRTDLNGTLKLRGA